LEAAQQQAAGGDFLTGAGYGGGIANESTLTATDLTLSDNQAIGGAGNKGGRLRA